MVREVTAVDLPGQVLALEEMVVPATAVQSLLPEQVGVEAVAVALILSVAVAVAPGHTMRVVTIQQFQI
jgi:hypothetical protein